METLRRVLWLSLGLIGLWLGYAWQKEYESHPATQTISRTAQALFEAKPSELVKSPLVETDLSVIPAERQITFKTDVIEGVIDKEGGHLVYLALLRYPKSIHTNDPFVILDHNNERYYIAQTDLLKPGELAASKPTPYYQSQANHYSLSQDKDTVCIELHRQEEGVEITKQFLLKKGHYHIDVHYKLNNHSQRRYKTQPYAELIQRKVAHKKQWLSNTAYNGGILSSDTKPYEKVPFDKMGQRRFIKNAQPSWLSFVEPYFASAWVSKSATAHYSYHHHNTYTLGMLGTPWEIEPGKQLTRSFGLYAGPKKTEILKAVAPHLDLLVDYGIFWFIATNLFWLLKQCHYWLQNWGWAIVCATIILKLSLYRVSAKQFQTSMTMRQLQTKVDDLKTRYRHDQQALNQATIDLYRREGVNPLSGSLIAFVQVPISLALNAVLLESIELRHEPFVFWLKDLAATDSYYVLPILLGITMLIELWIDQKLVPQAKGTSSQSNPILFFVPPIFTLVATNFPTGLALYWLVQNTASSLQKWWILGRPFPKTISFFAKRS